MEETLNLRIYFSDFFGVDKEILKQEGLFDISLVNDLPLFIDPFQLFNSSQSDYQALHRQIVEYVKFLHDESDPHLSKALLEEWYTFKEIKQNWFGYSKIGNAGHGLGIKFATILNRQLRLSLNTIGNETITKGTHLEKLSLIRDGVGRDNISDLTTNLIKGYLAKRTEDFAKKYVDARFLQKFHLPKAEFSYETKTWKTVGYFLPKFNDDYVILTPIDMLTKDDAWISQRELIEDFSAIADSISNDQLRGKVTRYLGQKITEKSTARERHQVFLEALEKFPEIVDYYIRQKEGESRKAKLQSAEKIAEATQLFVARVRELAGKLYSSTPFYEDAHDTYEAAHRRVKFLKEVIEDRDGYRVFYIKSDKPIRRESDLHVMFKLTWFASVVDVNAEVNNGRGPADFLVSKGSADKTVVEFKLASNTKLKQNLQNQAKAYEKAAKATRPTIHVILYFKTAEFVKVNEILKELGLLNSRDIVLIDARPNKESGSKIGGVSKAAKAVTKGSR